jgi:hypothetical protein
MAEYRRIYDQSSNGAGGGRTQSNRSGEKKAANRAGEGEASDEESATTTSLLAPTPLAPTPTVPAAPTGVLGAGGTKQVTVSWPAVSGATSYNLYWSATAGVTKTTGTKFTGAKSPTVQNGMTDATTYFYIVTAQNGAGEGAASSQATATTNAVPTPPPPAVTWALHTLYCSGCHGTSKRTASVSAVRGAITNDIGNMGMLGSANCTSCHGASKAGQSALTDTMIANILAGN